MALPTSSDLGNAVGDRPEARNTSQSAPVSGTSPAPDTSSQSAPAPDTSLQSAPAPDTSLQSAPAPDTSLQSAPAPDTSLQSAPAPDTSSSQSAPAPDTSQNAPTPGEQGQLLTRHRLGMLLLGVVVVLWVSGNFLTWALFSNDQTYSKPYLVSYVNACIFSIYLVPWTLQGGIQDLVARYREGGRPWGALDKRGEYSRIRPEGDEEIDTEGKLGIFATIRLSLEFSILWFLANYFSAVCYVYTSAASGSILSSTSSAWTFILCAIFRVERFTWTKVLAVLISLAGITLISGADRNATPNQAPSGDTQTTTLAPIRTAAEALLGDFLALVGAVFYGFYTTLLKVRVGDESRIDMRLLFGFSGMIIALMLWPGVVLAHLFGWEAFELPPRSTVWLMLGANFSMNLVADVSWAYAMLLTTPLLVTMGLSLTIPVALFAQLILLWEIPGLLYWVGAGLVFGAFFLVNKESKVDKSGGSDTGQPVECVGV